MEWAQGGLGGLALGLVGFWLAFGGLLVGFWWAFGGLLVSCWRAIGELLVGLWWACGGLAVVFLVGFRSAFGWLFMDFILSTRQPPIPAAPPPSLLYANAGPYILVGYILG